ncbi:uncharacterized protein LOC116301627 isoform X2 [Actinia tenebrosa]|uniref:Uncharacterized protein LOC116301627 isoform X2 n=1 Tax=Actinia tenebrosa TaxID=6105 RepID=A0A6P8IIL4_ACTTE|nr:uncharacterized protein LOC116301627 isoform X2 [Actinia tenebrosa]
MKDLHLKAKTLLGFLIVVSWLGTYVNACPVGDYEAKCRSCVNTFVDNLRQDPKINCSTKYASLRECISLERTRCLATPGISTSTKAMIRQRAMVYAASEEFFCVDGMFNSMKHYKRSALPKCKAKFFRKVAKCRVRFRKRFLKNRGSSSLCRYFYKAKKCMISALTKNCKNSKFLPHLVSTYKQAYNPYCRNRQDPLKKQIRSSGQFGRCSQRRYVINSRECIKDFMHSLQRNGGTRCRATVDAVLLPCTSSRMKRCLKGTRDAKTLDKNIKQGLEAQKIHIYNQYCEGGFLETLPLSRDQCSEEYFETFQRRCYAKFITKYRENKANPLLCQDYAEVKRCARNMTISHCTLDDSMQDAVRFLYGDFNPFCHNGKDPEKPSDTRGFLASKVSPN